MLLAPAFASLLSGPLSGSLSVGGGLPLRPRAFRPSPSHRCAAGPSLYKRGCLRLRNSPAASRPAASRRSAPPASLSRVQNGLSCPRDRVTDVLPAGCQQRAGLRSLRSLRPLPTSTASALRANLYPSGPSPCPCPGVDTPARRRILPSSALPCAKRPLLPPGPARRGHQHVSRRLYFGNSGIITIFVPVLKR